MGHAGGIGNPYSMGIANFVSSFNLSNVPDNVKHRAKLLFLDSIGCGLYGARLEWTRKLIAAITKVDQTKSCSLLAGLEKMGPLHAALVNGTQIQGFELDDVHRKGVLHVGAVTLPPLFALAELNPDITGNDFLRAAIAGYEIGPRVGLCMGQEHIGQGWHSGATVGVFSAVAGAANLLKLTAEETLHAIGIAGTQSSGLMAAQFGAMVKRMHAGKSAHSGLLAALLAKEGFTGIVDVFEAPYGGFCSTFSRSEDRFDLEQLVAGLGEEYQLMNIALKFYSCVGSNHTTLDAIKDIQKRRLFSMNDFKEIRVFGSRVTVDHVGWDYRPEGLTSAQLNLPFCVATLLLEGDVFVDQFTSDCVGDQARIALSRKIKVIHDPNITKRGSGHRHMVTVEVEFENGDLESETREYPRGSEYDFASDEEIIGKFRTLAKGSISDTSAKNIVDMVMNIEALGSANLLLAEMSG
jgi:aconitate decarboxylase